MPSSIRGGESIGVLASIWSERRLPKPPEQIFQLMDNLLEPLDFGSETSVFGSQRLIFLLEGGHGWARSRLFGHSFHDDVERGDGF